MKSSFFRTIILFTFSIGLFSCIPNKKVIYFQHLANQQKIDSIAQEFNAENYLLQKSDILDIKISSIDPRVNSVFNAQVNASNAGMQGVVQSGGDVFFLNGYSIDDSGRISLPIIGSFFVAGLQVGQVKAKIDSALKDYFTEYHLLVRLGGLRFTAIGEFNRSGKYVLMQNRATIFEAIAQSGDLTILAKRDALTLVRQYPDGSRIHKINLLDKNIIHSSLYWIQPNDLLYAEPLKVRELGTGLTGIQTLTTALSIISSTLLIISLTNRL